MAKATKSGVCVLKAPNAQPLLKTNVIWKIFFKTGKEAPGGSNFKMNDFATRSVIKIESAIIRPWRKPILRFVTLPSLGIFYNILHAVLLKAVSL